MGRRKRKKITYDSKETSTFFGLLCLLFSIFFAIAYLSVNPNDQNIFSQARSLFNNSTLLTAITLGVIGIKLLGAESRFLKLPNIISLTALTFLVPAFISTLNTDQWTILKADPISAAGGRVGYYIVVDLLGDKIPTQPATQIILLLSILILTPIALSVSLSSLTQLAGKFINKVFKIVKALFTPIDQLTGEQSEEIDEFKQPRSRFGDFNDLIKKREAEKLAMQTKSADDTLERQYPESPLKIIKPAEQMSINYKHVDLGDDGLSQETLKFPGWTLPPASLLLPPEKPSTKETDIKEKAGIIEEILLSFDIDAKVEQAFVGPSVIQYALSIPLGIKVSKVANLNENIALALGVDSKAVRVETIPETSYLGVEIPRSSRDLVRIKELMTSEKMRNTDYVLPVPIGKNIHGEAVIGNIYKMPHLLIAGATGSGKSVLTNTFITSLIMKKTPDELKLILVDPKQVELMDYNGIPHLITPVITQMEQVVDWLKWTVKEMETRYSILAKEQVRNIEGYNSKKGFAAMPYIVVVIDEMADMMMTAGRVEAENAIVRLAQKARAVGIHLILATQRPSVNVITGIIKANIPGRVGMSVTSSTDSRVILDRIGAESLMGSGDLLYKAPDKTKAERLQCAFIEQSEVTSIVEFIKAQVPEDALEYLTIDQIRNEIRSPEEMTAEALGEISGDDLVEQAIYLVVQARKASSSYLQRRLSIGFNRAARLLEELEEAGVVGPANGSKPREVLIDDADSYITKLRGN